MSERRQKACEVAMRRRLGASPEHAAKVRTYMLAADDLFTTCQLCKRRVRGSLEMIRRHIEVCNGD